MIEYVHRTEPSLCDLSFSQYIQITGELNQVQSLIRHHPIPGLTCLLPGLIEKSFYFDLSDPRFDLFAINYRLTDLSYS